MKRLRGWRAIGPAGTLGLSVILFMLAIAALGPIMLPTDPDAISLSETLQPPSWAHPIGTDELGRDVLVRLLHGGRVSLAVGIGTAVLAVGFGALVGAVAGYSGGWLDEIISRVVDLFLSFPLVVVALVLSAFMNLDIVGIVLLIAAFSWMSVARLVRGHVLSLREREFVIASITLGASGSRVLRSHLLPNTLPVVLVAAALLVPYAILIEAALSFLGAGIQLPTPTWGNMLQNAPRYMRDAPWLAVAPGVLITVTVASFIVLGDALRRATAGRRE